MSKTNSRKFIEERFPNLLNCKRRTSRMYAKGDKPGYRDSWWFNFMEDDLEGNDFLVFAGAMDYNNKNFKLFKIPTIYIKSNINKIDKGNNGWINIYLHFTEFIDLRNKSNLSFKGFELN